MSRSAVVMDRCQDGIYLRLEAHPMGEDWNVSIYGGDRPHIGAAALGTPYPKPDGSWSACASVLALPTHKEDVLARQAALLLAKRTRRTVLVACGIHVDGLSPQGIAAVVTLAEEAVETLADRLAAL